MTHVTHPDLLTHLTHNPLTLFQLWLVPCWMSLTSSIVEVAESSENQLDCFSEARHKIK